MIKKIAGGVCAPKGFRAGGVHCGIRKNKIKKDLALIVSDMRCVAAGVYTTNLVKGAPVVVTRSHLADGYAQAVIVNSGNANTCNADGVEMAEKTCLLASSALSIPAEDIAVGSTGVIGLKFSTDPIEAGMQELISSLSGDEAGSDAAAEAIMTTDTVKKSVSYSFELGGKECRIGAIAKGVGMICPNMATMLGFITTDIAISPAMLQAALSKDVKTSFNMLSVDRDTSTNDTLLILASGLAGNPEITARGKDFTAFCRVLHKVTVALCRMLASDGEGATKLIECRVRGAKTAKDARLAAKAVVCSDLVKTMIFGADANGGRVMCALGYSGAKLDIGKVDVDFRSKAGVLSAYRGGAALEFSEEHAKKVLSEKEIRIEISLGDGKQRATAWGCDLTYDYVKINGDYRT